MEVWPVEEFTYLRLARWNGTRAPYLALYWHEANPHYCDGAGAESFSTLLRRAEEALGRLAALPAVSLVYVFSHGQFIQAVMAETALSDQAKMRRFWQAGAPPAIGNAELVVLDYTAGQWHLREGTSAASSQ